MREQPQAWSDRQEPVKEDVPAQRPPAEEQPNGTGPDGAWAPPAERVAAGRPDEDRETAEDRAVTDEDRAVENEDRAVENEDRAVENEDRAVENEDRAVGVASVPNEGAARDEGAVRDEAARDEATRDEAGRDGTATDDEVRNDAALHDAAHETRYEPALVDNGDDNGGVGTPVDEPVAAGVPDDAVSRDDAPVPAAAYDTTDRDVADSGAAGTEAELMPGDVPQEPVSALFEGATASDFRDRWQRVQMQFVDDPQSAAEQARSLVDDVVSALHDALTNQRGSLDSWQSGPAGDTEELRVAVRRYRDFLDRILGL